MKQKDESTKVRYAVVGLGYIAQIAILPAFKHAAKNSVLAALVSDDPAKLRTLGKRYHVEHTSDYAGFEACLRDGEIDAVFIALPNDMHCEYTGRAARAGVHVLCEKPMAVTVEDCEAMIRATEDAGLKLMIAYRLHFEEANMQAVEMVRSGKLGEPRIFTSTFTMQVQDGNIRLKNEHGGGTLYDIGIYCINAARYLFRAEPIEVCAFTANNGERRFHEVDEMTSAILRFPDDRLASFTCSFGAADVSTYHVIGTKGELRVEPAYEFAEGLAYRATIDGRTRTHRFPKRDQFAPEILHFSECVQRNRNPEPSGREGLADVRVIEALYLSAAMRRSVRLAEFEKRTRPTLKQAIARPGIAKPRMIHAAAPSGGS